MDRKLVAIKSLQVLCQLIHFFAQLDLNLLQLRNVLISTGGNTANHLFIGRLSTTKAPRRGRTWHCVGLEIVLTGLHATLQSVLKRLHLCIDYLLGTLHGLIVALRASGHFMSRRGC